MFSPSLIKTKTVELEPEENFLVQIQAQCGAEQTKSWKKMKILYKNIDLILPHVSGVINRLVLVAAFSTALFWNQQFFVSIFLWLIAIYIKYSVRRCLSSHPTEFLFFGASVELLEKIILLLKGQWTGRIPKNRSMGTKLNKLNNRKL